MTRDLINSDKILKNIIAQLEPPSFVSTNNVFHDLVGCLIEQQIHYRSSKRIYLRALERAGIDVLTLDKILLYTLQRPNVFPYDDYSLKLIMTKVYNLNPDVKLKAQMLSIAEQWGSHKSLAVLYLLKWKEFLSKK